MSNFNFLKKDLEWKIVKTQCLGPTAHTPHNPQMAPYHHLYLFIIQYSCILTSCAKRTHNPSPFLFALVRLSYILVQERKYTFPGTPEMSDKLRYEWRLYLHPFTTPIAFLVPIFSLLNYNSREKTIHTYTIIPPFLAAQKWVTNWDMSRKSF
jgi:hypothetical protein